tara:strand:- start:1055 stop:1426 length:372 start_codon:yes stop_codon:yes gene_type:complete
MILTPVMAAAALQILPSIGSLVGELTGKKKDAALLSSILALPGMAAGVFGKSSSTGLQIGKGIEGVGPLADPKDYIGGLTGSIADKTQQNFAGVLDMRIGSPVDYRSNQASLFDFNRGLLGLG